MKYIILVLWTFSLFLLMFSSFPFRVECRPTRAMGPGPPYLPGAGVFPPQQQYSSSSALGVRATGGRFGYSSCPVLEGPGSPPSNKPSSIWPELYSTDITEKVWETQLVLEGMARSRSEVRSDGTYGVTFDLIRVVKGDAPLLRRRKQFRLQFLEIPVSPVGANSTSGTGVGVLTMSSGRNTGLILPPSRTSSGASTSRNPGSGLFNPSSSHNNHHHHLSTSNNNYNRALDLRSNSNSKISQSSQQQRSSLSGGGGSASGRVSGGAVTLKSSSLHSNYVNLQQHQQLLTRRAYLAASGRHLRGAANNTRVSSSQAVQLSEGGSRNYRSSGVNSSPQNVTIGSGRSGRASKNVRIARSHQQQQQQLVSNLDSATRHGRRHGRVVGLGHNSLSVVNSASGSGKCLPPRAAVKTGRKYFVFAAKVENHFVAVFSPELANKRNTKAVEGILCKGCGQPPSVVAPKEVMLQPKERLRLRCRLRAGNPIPVLTWFKDGRLVNLTDPRFRLRVKRRQSVLVIRRAKEMDTGVYKCEGRNAFGSAHVTTRVSLSQQPPVSSPPQKPAKPPSPKPVGTTPRTSWAVPSSVCPFDSYCLNGGTCSYYETIGEYVCQCAEGYKGQRCDTKDIPNSGSYLSYFCIFGTNNPDYPC